MREKTKNILVMRIPKKIKIAAVSILGIVGLLFVVLVVHIATAKPVVYDNATLQISRIDFEEAIDSAKAKEIHRNLKSIPGVKNDRINLEKGVVVYFHDNKVINSEEVFNQLIAKGNYKAKRYVISNELAQKKACPVMNEDSFSYKFSRGVQRIFN
jgi:copper chaperone CopZ